MSQNPSSIEIRYLLSAIVIIAVAAFALLILGRTPICECGFVKLWHGEVMSSENSQHIADWYSPSHVVHGILFYGLLAWIAGSLSVAIRFNMAVLIEVIWEIGENTDYVINRYREATISLDYFGDSIINSVADIMFMIVGFLIAWRFPVWISALLAVGLELLAGIIIRDNLVLNLIMLIYPFEFIKAWQLG